MRRALVAAVLLAVPVVGCGFGSEDPIVTPPGPAIAVRPASLILALGSTDTVFALITGVATGADRTMQWSAGDTTVVRITALSPPDHALVTGLKPGTTAVTAAWRADPTVRGSAEVIVR